MASLSSRLARTLLIFHAIFNTAQGLYTLFFPQSYSLRAGAMFINAPDKALQSIGLGPICVGYYQLIFSYQGARGLILATIPMRLLFAGVMVSWGGGFEGVVAYEMGVAVVCGLALFT